MANPKNMANPKKKAEEKGLIETLRKSDKPGIAFFREILWVLVVVGVIALVLFVVCSFERNSNLRAALYSVLLGIPILVLGVLSSVGVALAIAVVMLAALLLLMSRARQHRSAQWDWSMLRLPTGESRPWYAGTGLWWLVFISVFALIYYRFW